MTTIDKHFLINIQTLHREWLEGTRLRVQKRHDWGTLSHGGRAAIEHYLEQIERTAAEQFAGLVAMMEAVEADARQHGGDV